MKNKQYLNYLYLNILLAVYSLGTVCSKFAAQFNPFTVSFFLCYGGVILTLGIYAVGWQQIIKRMPLTNAFANKAVTVVWGIVWGVVFFQEQITFGKILGALLVITGVILYAKAGDERAE